MGDFFTSIKQKVTRLSSTLGKLVRINQFLAKEILKNKQKEVDTKPLLMKIKEKMGFFAPPVLALVGTIIGIALLIGVVLAGTILIPMLLINTIIDIVSFIGKSISTGIGKMLTGIKTLLLGSEEYREKKRLTKMCNTIISCLQERNGGNLQQPLQQSLQQPLQQSLQQSLQKYLHAKYKCNEFQIKIKAMAAKKTEVINKLQDFQSNPKNFIKDHSLMIDWISRWLKESKDSIGEWNKIVAELNAARTEINLPIITIDDTNEYLAARMRLQLLFDQTKQQSATIVTQLKKQTSEWKDTLAKLTDIVTTVTNQMGSATTLKELKINNNDNITQKQKHTNNLIALDNLNKKIQENITNITQEEMIPIDRAKDKIYQLYLWFFKKDKKKQHIEFQDFQDFPKPTVEELKELKELKELEDEKEHIMM